MNNDFLLLLDNSFKENYCYYSTEQELGELNKKWNLIIESISIQLSDFEDKDFEFIDIPFGMFEAIGFGSFNKELSNEKRQLLTKCFPNASDLLIPKSEFEESQEEVIKKYLDDNFVKTFNRLFEFYENEVDPKEIVKKIREKKQNKLHPNVEALNKELEKWEHNIKLGKESPAFLQLCRDLAWNAFVKHQKWFITEKDIDPKYWEIKNNSGNNSFIQLKEIHIIRRLIAYYLDNIQNNGYLAGAVLFSKYAKLLKAKKESPDYLRPYSLAQELLDPYLIEYACSGLYVNNSLQRKKIIIITCEKFSQKKISDYIDAKKKINTDLEKIGIKAEPFMPGYIIIIDDKTHQIYKNIIDISKLI